MFRDKRIPRENLNGLVVTKNGMAAALYGFTGMGEYWAQDPPFYADIVSFGTDTEKDWAHIRIRNWRGWDHDRRIYLYRDGGPVIVEDEAVGPPSAQSAFVWHVVGAEQVGRERFRLYGRPVTAEIAFEPAQPYEAEISRNGNAKTTVVYYTSRLRTTITFFP